MAGTVHKALESRRLNRSAGRDRLCRMQVGEMEAYARRRKGNELCWDRTMMVSTTGPSDVESLIVLDRFADKEAEFTFKTQ